MCSTGNFLDDIFHPQDPICRIVKTNTEKKCDIFAQYRSEARDRIDYHISQTDTKLDAGTTKIHIQQTDVELGPPAKKLSAGLACIKKPKCYRGAPPVWEFVEEIQRRKQEELQKIYQEQFKLRVIHRKKTVGKEALRIHRKILAMVGPAWFQELSPKQMTTADNLKNCILKDWSDGTIINTQENIACLGLVPRPHHKKIEKALKNCCKCPVEFLLILYQLVGPKRVKYSINDRILLSAVVHLTMTDTLKELHIRIPSPPPPPKVAAKVPKKKRKVKFESPYLETFTFEREPPKFSGIYCNKHVQKPQSPYFSYLKQLKNTMQAKEQKFSKTNVLVKEEKEIEEETQLAQNVYAQLVNFRPVPNLLKPSIYKTCYNFRNKRLPVKQTEEEKEELIANTSCEVDQEGASLVQDTNQEIEDDKLKEEQILKTGCCEIEEKSENFSSKVCKEKEFSSHQEQRNGRKKKLKRCKCKQRIRKIVDQPFYFCKQCQEDRSKKVVKTQTTSVGEDLVAETSCSRLEKYEDKTKEQDQRKRTLFCSCKEVIEEIINKPFCSCEKCIEDRKIRRQSCTCLQIYQDRINKFEEYQKRRQLIYSMKQQEKKYIIGGVVNTAAGPVYIISGMQSSPDCITEKKSKKAAMPVAPPGRTVYAISGVKETPEGNVYILNSATATPDCDCMGIYKEFEKQHSPCLQMYEAYLEKSNEEINEFMRDMLPPRGSRVSEGSASNNKAEVDMYLGELRPCLEPEYGTIKEEPVYKNVETEECCASSHEENDVADLNYEILSTNCCERREKVECKECRCGKEKHEPVMAAVLEEKAVHEGEREISVNNDQKLKRFFIFKKILSNRKWQSNVLKQALESMASDGYPLAKLPQCYKLPHFKLWMQMRSGKFWTQQDKYDYILKSKFYWRHCEKCTVKKTVFTKVPKLPLTRAEARLLDWSKARSVRKLVNDVVEGFYRKVKRNIVNFGREFFPTTFSHKFPSPTWRPCFFSYAPCKKEEVLARFTWQTHDFRDMSGN